MFLSELQAQKLLNRAWGSQIAALRAFTSIRLHSSLWGQGLGKDEEGREGMPPTHLSSACASHTEEFPPALSSEELHTNLLKALKSINPTICDVHGYDMYDLPIALRKKKVWNTSYSFDYHFLLIRWNVKCCQEPAILGHPSIVRHTHTKKAQQILAKFCMLLLKK